MPKPDWIGKEFKRIAIEHKVSPTRSDWYASDKYPWPVGAGGGGKSNRPSKMVSNSLFAIVGCLAIGAGALVWTTIKEQPKAVQDMSIQEQREMMEGMLPGLRQMMIEDGLKAGVEGAFGQAAPPGEESFEEQINQILSDTEMEIAAITARINAPQPPVLGPGDVEPNFPSSAEVVEEEVANRGPRGLPNGGFAYNGDIPQLRSESEAYGGAGGTGGLLVSPPQPERLPTTMSSAAMDALFALLNAELLNPNPAMDMDDSATAPPAVSPFMPGG